MKKISYTYATQNADPLVPVVVGQILSENNGNTGQVVSRLHVPFILWRNEIRGDGPSGNGPVRSFRYNGAHLERFTDFQGHESTISYQNGYVSAFKDARNHITNYQREGPNGALSVLTHPDPEQSNKRFSYRYVHGAPYFLEIQGDERNLNSNTYIVRDPVTHRVTKVWYPDYPIGPTEEFTYTPLGQVETHTMTSGGVANFRYDARGLMTESWPPSTPSDPNPEQHKTRYFYYTSGPDTDRLWHVVDPRGNTTWFEYNRRGQVTKITHQDGTFRQNGYNADGTLAWTADENHPNASWNVSERTRYVYDDYKRVISVTNPLNETTTMSYAAPNGAGSHSHTTGAVYRVTSPMGKKTDFDYDENLRQKMVRKGAESPDDDGGTWLGYDEVGNLTSLRDPRNHITTFGYDERNRRTSSTAPYPFNNQITRWEYDPRSNLTKEIRPDLSFRRVEYDAQSRVIDTYGFANEHIHYERDLAGNIKRLIDPKPATYFFDYDKLNRKISATYPEDATGAIRTETFRYDIAGNLALYKNPAGQYKHFDFPDSYDSRNRLRHSAWNLSETTASADWSVGQEVRIIHDDASRLTSVTTNNGETIVAFGYDNANRQILEDQTVAGYPTRRVDTVRDADGNRDSLHVPGEYFIRYDYTRRNQLWHIYDGNGVEWFNYNYDTAGNLIKRQDVYGGSDSTNFDYDELNRVTMAEQTYPNENIFARSHYRYDNLSRQFATWRDEDGSKGDLFGFSPTNQLTTASYKADWVWTGVAHQPDRPVEYAYTPDKLNRSAVNDNGSVWGYQPNALNQYTGVGGLPLNYDGNFNLTSFYGLGAAYNAANQLVSASKNGNSVQFLYDGLGRCLKRTINGASSIIVYDGWKSIIDWDSTGSKSWNIYGAGADEILWRMQANKGHLRYKLDGQGNVAFLLDWAGNIIERYRYDAFGEPSAITDWYGDPHEDANDKPLSAYGNRFMFQGREYFPELGIYDNRNRFYHPFLGRFLQSDPIGFAAGDANPFRYCGDDPVNRNDPSGLLEVTKQSNEASTAPVFVYGSPLDPHGAGIFADAATDWGTFGDVMHYLGGGDRGGVSLSDGGALSLSPDASGIGVSTSLSRTSATQGYWTDLDGLPVGSPWVFVTNTGEVRPLSEVLLSTWIARRREGPKHYVSSERFRQWDIITLWSKVLGFVPTVAYIDTYVQLENHYQISLYRMTNNATGNTWLELRERFISSWWITTRDIHWEPGW